jgi:hypothetical protein
MRELTIDLPEAKRIKINGEIYEIFEDDIDILENAAVFLETISALTANGEPDAAQTVKTVRELIDYTDKILGVGAVKRLTKGRRVGLAKNLDILTVILKAIIEEYNEKVLTDYE